MGESQELLTSVERVATQEGAASTTLMGSPQAPVSINPMAMIQMAVEKDAPIERLEKLLDLQERWEANEAKKAFDAAMAAFKAECPKIDKNHTVSYTNSKNQVVEYKHATLDNICAIINPIMGKHGLSYSWDTNQESGHVYVTCHIHHAMGHISKGVQLFCSPDTSGSKNGIQSIGSAVTYLKRYTLEAAAGLSTEIDDDGDASGEEESPAGETASQAEPQQIHYYPEEKFQGSLPKWLQYIREGKRTVEQIISFADSKAPLTDEQKQAIRQGAKK